MLYSLDLLLESRLREMAYQQLTIAAVLRHYVELFNTLAQLEDITKIPFLGYAFEKLSDQDLEHLRTRFRVDYLVLSDNSSERRQDLNQRIYKLSQSYQTLLTEFDESLKQVSFTLIALQQICCLSFRVDLWSRTRIIKFDCGRIWES
jgi:hypothetical protein